MYYNKWNKGVGGLGTGLNLLNIQMRKSSLNTAQIVRSSPDPCHMITSVRTQPLSSFIRELTNLGREHQPRLHQTKAVITEIKAVQLCRKHNLKDLLSK